LQFTFIHAIIISTKPVLNCGDTSGMNNRNIGVYQCYEIVFALWITLCCAVSDKWKWHGGDFLKLIIFSRRVSMHCIVYALLIACLCGRYFNNIMYVTILHMCTNCSLLKDYRLYRRSYMIRNTYHLPLCCFRIISYFCQSWVSRKKTQSISFPF